MIDPISAFSTLVAAHGALKKAVEISGDINKAQGAIMRQANAEAELQVGAKRAKKRRFGGLMDDAIEQHFKEEEQKRLHDELRSMFMLYGGPGQWERLQKVIAHARAEKKKELEEALHKRDMIRIIVVIGVTTVVGICGIYFWIQFLQGL